VISPLIALMKNQVDELREKGISAAYINSSLDPIERRDRFTRFTRNEYRLLYVSPEQLLSTRFLRPVVGVDNQLVVIDEAHCISEWGHDFRPAYQKISLFIRRLKSRPRPAAFTASATSREVNDICFSLQMSHPEIFTESFHRKNIFLSVHRCREHYERDTLVFRILREHKNESGIIYCATRETVEYVTLLLQRFYLRSVAYHAGLTGAERFHAQEDFFCHRVDIIVATSAFGMGMNKKDIRYVIHYQPPTSMTVYYQEVGRSGRDGLSASCHFLFWSEDARIMKHISSEYERVVQFATQQDCHTRKVLGYFGEEFSDEKCNHCNICIPKKYLPTEEEIASADKLLKLRDTLANEEHQAVEILPMSVINAVVLHKPKKIDLIPGTGIGLMEKWSQEVNTALWYSSPS